MSERILLGPGPSLIPPSVQAALARPLVGHMDPELLPLLDEITGLLRSVFQSGHEITLPISGTGTAGMEAALINALEPGDRLLVVSSGYFAERIAKAGRKLGADVALAEAPWGQAVDPDGVRRALAVKRAKLVAAVHVETSTGVLQPLPDIVAIAHDQGALMLVDAVASLAGVDLPVERWGIDLCYSGTQKCLSAPPGMAPITVSAEVRRRRASPVQSFYLDLALLWEYWAKPHVYHHTVPVPLVFALHEALRLVAAEGLTARFSRHRLNADALMAGLEALGLTPYPPQDLRSPSVITVRIPERVEDANVRRRLLEEFGIEIAGGLGPLRGKIWRIGLMGHSSQAQLVLQLLSALEAILPSEGHRLEPGVGPAAASRVLSGAHVA